MTFEELINEFEDKSKEAYAQAAKYTHYKHNDWKSRYNIEGATWAKCAKRLREVLAEQENAGGP